MNSKIERFLYLAISFIIGSFFFIIGAFSIVLPWSSFLQYSLTNFILENTLLFSLFGLGLTLIGLSIIISAIVNAKRRYFYIRIGSRSIAIDKTLVQQYLDAYWKELFPHHPVSCSFAIRKNYLQITADLPSLPKSEQQTCLEKINQDFTDIFGKVLGYPHEVHLMANFKSKQTT